MLTTATGVVRYRVHDPITLVPTEEVVEVDLHRQSVVTAPFEEELAAVASRMRYPSERAKHAA